MFQNESSLIWEELIRLGELRDMGVPHIKASLGRWAMVASTPDGADSGATPLIPALKNQILIGCLILVTCSAI